MAADGNHVEPVLVTRVTGRDGTVLWRADPRRSRVLPAATSRTVTGVLQQVVERGTAVNARIGRPVAGKTGTGEEWSDAWFVGYTPELVAAVWVGFPDSIRTMRPPATRIVVTGGSWPAQIWQGFAGAFLADTWREPELFRGGHEIIPVFGMYHAGCRSTEVDIIIVVPGWHAVHHLVLLIT